MMPSRWSNVLRRVTTAGPYVNERLSIVVPTSVVAAGIIAVAYADKSVTSLSLGALYFLPLAVSALVHPLRNGADSPMWFNEMQEGNMQNDASGERLKNST